MKKKIIIVGGDLNSINSELIYKSWKKLDQSIKKRIYIISNFQLLKRQFKKLKYSINIKKVNSIDEHSNKDFLKILNIQLKSKNAFKIPDNESSKFVLNSLNLAHKLALKKEVAGILNCPIDKKLLKKKKIGVTEYLASKCKIKKNSEVMLIKNRLFTVSPMTTHLDIKDVSKNINKSLILNKVKTINNWFKRQENKKPKIAMLGLNPHNAEFRKDSEEYKIISPTILKLKKKGVNLTGPLVSDTIFIENYKKFDVVIGMYHDQVLAPFKTLYKFDAINITLGLKYLRVSPDHGIAKDLIGKNKANITSFMNCIKFVDEYKK
tara:strand:+ start:4716 stop:5681 length:966 start_codon:yes stop_codon:yes gene_type:complete